MGQPLRSPEVLNMIADFLMEMVATFGFTLVAGLTYGETTLIPALVVGLSCAVLVSSEQAHMNPVVTLAIALCHQYMSLTTLLLSLLAQFIGCVFGGLIAVHGLRHDVLSFSQKSSVSASQCFVFEMIFSCVLVLVVVRTSELRDSSAGAFAHGLCYSIAILCGFLLFEGNPLINPIVAVGLLIGSSSLQDDQTDEVDIWIYLVGPFIGCLLAVNFYLLTEFKCNEEEEFSDKSPVDEDETTEFQPVRKPQHGINSANYQQGPSLTYIQPSRANYQHSGSNYVNYQQGRTYHQPRGANYQHPGGADYKQRGAADYKQPRNQQPALRQRRVLTNPQALNAQPVTLSQPRNTHRQIAQKTTN